MDRIKLLLAKLRTTKPLTTDEAVIVPSALGLCTPGRPVARPAAILSPV